MYLLAAEVQPTPMEAIAVFLQHIWEQSHHLAAEAVVLILLAMAEAAALVVALVEGLEHLRVEVEPLDRALLVETEPVAE
jgi:hypothetical protein